MSLIKVKKHFQITLPSNLRKNLRIAEGDYLEAQKQDSQLILKPVKMIPTDEAYFHTKEWQKGEAKADNDIKKGEVLGPFANIADGLKALKKPKYEATLYQDFCPGLSAPTRGHSEHR